MHARYPPFNAANDELIMEKVRIGKYSYDSAEWNYVSREAKEFISKLIEKDPKKRYSVIIRAGRLFSMNESSSSLAAAA